MGQRLALQSWQPTACGCKPPQPFPSTVAGAGSSGELETAYLVILGPLLSSQHDFSELSRAGPESFSDAFRAKLLIQTVSQLWILRKPTPVCQFGNRGMRAERYGHARTGLAD